MYCVVTHFPYASNLRTQLKWLTLDTRYMIYDYKYSSEALTAAIEDS